MALVTGELVFDGGLGEFEPDHVILRIAVPFYEYSIPAPPDEGDGVRETVVPDTIVVARRTAGESMVCEVTMPVDGGTYRVHVPGETVLGTSLRALLAWTRATTWDEWFVDVSYAIAGPDRTVVASGAFEALFFIEDLADGRIDGREAFGQQPSLPPRVFFVNADEYRRLVAEHPAPPGRTDQYALQAIQQLGVFTARSARLGSLSDDDLAALADRIDTAVEVLQAIIERWEPLTTFPITVAAPDTVEAAGTLRVVTPDEGSVKVDEFGYYRVTAEVPVRTLGGGHEPIAFAAEFEPLDDPVTMPVAFTLVPEHPVVSSAAAGPVTVRVRGFDGAVLWRRNFASGDDQLRELDITVSASSPGELEPGPDGRSPLERKIRGQVLRRSGEQKVSGLTVVLQTKEDPAAALWTIVSAGETDGSGYFWMSYPRGAFVAAQAIVSASPDSAVDLRIVTDGPAGETLADDFLYLLLDDIVEQPTGTGAGRPARLPDQADLVRSDEYSQDLGGSCINVTTPNRTLREYSYNAIVRTSDPDVANYTLHKAKNGSYTLAGGGEKLERKPVDLTNPIRWQDAPEAGDKLNFYQAVTVATGHILFFKSVVKADGYSLGDLVYSLPLAPGQKKQIVSYDVANTLEAAESQQTVQAERLAAGLVDDRFITDQLSGGIGETISGSSSASTAGISAGLGLGGSVGAISGSLGVAGGYSNSRSNASQSGSRSITQFFGERLRQTLTQNAEGYRQLNASVVTTVKEGQEYAVTSEVVANHNHCHSLTMMYFEVLRHYVIQQELADVQEALFVPLLLTEFTPDNIAKWKDVLAANLLPTPSNTYLPQLLTRRLTSLHPLVRAFDANDRIKSDYARVDFPEATYADDPITAVDGTISLRVHFPRPRTRADRVISLPIVTEVVHSKRVDTMATVAEAFLSGGWSFFNGPSTTDVAQEIKVRADLFDKFMTLDANFQSVPPAQAIRVKDFNPQQVPVGDTTELVDFFQNNEDRERWQKYADILGPPNSPHELLNQYFAGRLISEWDGIFNTDLAPRLFKEALSAIGFEPVGDGAGLNLDFTQTTDYQGGERTMQVRVAGLGASHPARRALAPRLRIVVRNGNVVATSFATVDVQRVTLNYTTPHFRGTIFNGYVGTDLLDANGAELAIPLTPRDLRNPRKEDEYLQQELLDHLNAHVEHYNALLWRLLDANRRYMLLDGFTIETFTRTGTSAGMRSLASVVKNELITIVGNGLVFPVADGYHVSQSLVTAETEDDGDETVPANGGNPLFERYRPNDEMPPYRLSVPTRGVYSEAVLGRCDACEDVKVNSSQDWDRFRTDEPTTISPVVTPTPQRTDWKAVWAQLAQPIVQMQTPREAPAPGAGLAGLSDALTKSDAFRDVTGLAANQENVIRTYLSNQENAKAFAEMAKTMAMQEHNADNSRGIMQNLESARQSGAITDDDYRQMVRDHLGQQIDGGARQSVEVERESRQQPSLTNAAIQAAGSGRNVVAQRTDPDGTTESVQVGPTRQDGQPDPIHYDVPLVPQPNKTSCWAASMAMLEAYRRSVAENASVSLTAADLAAEVGYSLEQSYGWDRLESVKAFYGFDEIGLSGSQYPSAEEWRAWLAGYGPLYVTVGGAPTHAIIVHGISGDMTSAGTQLEVLNPWDINESFDDDPTVFNPANSGARLTWSVSELNQRLNSGDLDTLALYENWRILYLPALAPTHISTPSGQAGRRIFRLDVQNRFYERDPEIDCTVSILSAVFSLDISVTGSGLHPVRDAIPDGEHAFIVTPRYAATPPDDWASFATPAPGLPVPTRIWVEERATITVAEGRVTELRGNPNIELRGDKVTVRLRPLWAATPHKQPRPSAVEFVIVHRTGGAHDIPPHFILESGDVAAHYVITRDGDGSIVKLAHDDVDRVAHAGPSRWRSFTSLSDNSIGIEIVNLDSQDYEEAQYVALLELLTDLRARFPAIVPHQVLGHCDIAVNKEGYGPLQLGRRAVDPGRQFDWPRLEAAGFGIAPANPSEVFATTPMEDIYREFFKTDPTRRLPLSSGRPNDYEDIVREIKADLTTIGYSMPNSSSADYDDARTAVQVFKNRFFSGSRQQPDGFYNPRLDFETAQMIKRVLHAVTHP